MTTHVDEGLFNSQPSNIWWVIYNQRRNVDAGKAFAFISAFAITVSTHVTKEEERERDQV